jgi:hypothetical protein
MAQALRVVDGATTGLEVYFTIFSAEGRSPVLDETKVVSFSCPLAFARTIKNEYVPGAPNW